MQLRIIPIVVLILVSALPAAAQVSTDQFRQLLQDRAGLEKNDISMLDSGGIVVKLLPINDKREVAIVGVVHLRRTTEMTMNAFRTAFAPENNKAVISAGKFSSPPLTDDLMTLKFESKDIEELKKCKAGNCDLKLSADMINRARSEIDWNGADYQARASELLLAILIDYTRDYLSRGDKALIQIDSRAIPIRLADEHRALLESSPFVKELVPELRKYLTDYPSYKLSGLDDQLFWSKVNFGIKPIVTITQSVYYSKQFGELPQFALVTKQIFATRYLESSLAFGFWLNLKNIDSMDSYLVFTNLTRSDALTGALGGFKRTVAEGEAKSRVSEILRQARIRLEPVATNDDSQSSGSDDTGPFGHDPLLINRLVAVLSAVSIVIIIALIFYRISRRRRA